MTTGIARVVEYIQRTLPLDTAELTDEYFYGSLPLCVIDAIYSIGVRYEGVRRVVARYCERTGQRRVRPHRYHLPPRVEQESISSFCRRFEVIGLDAMTKHLFANRQRTSVRNGILKADAVYRFSLVLRRFGAEHLQDVGGFANQTAFETEIRAIPGQRSGISLQYFWMLAGSDDFIKPDRMVLRFLEAALDSPVRMADALPMLREATNALKSTYPALTPRLLDYVIWQHQRGVKLAAPNNAMQTDVVK